MTGAGHHQTCPEGYVVRLLEPQRVACLAPATALLLLRYVWLPASDLRPALQFVLVKVRQRGQRHRGEGGRRGGEGGGGGGGDEGAEFQFHD